MGSGGEIEWICGGFKADRLPKLTGHVGSGQEVKCPFMALGWRSLPGGFGWMGGWAVRGEDFVRFPKGLIRWL
jgi:hypothetical protein